MEERIIVPKNAIAIIVVYFYLLVLLFFSHCKDRPHSRTLQVFSTLFASDIATHPHIRDNEKECAQNLSRNLHFFPFLIAP